MTDDRVQTKVKKVRLRGRARIMLLILLFSLCITVIIGVVLGNEAGDYLTREINHNIVVSTEKSTNEVEAKLNHMTGLVDSVVASTISEYDIGDTKDASSEQQIRDFVKAEGKFLANCLRETSQAHSLYLVINPEMTDKPVESWFKRDSSGKIHQLTVDPDKKITDFANDDSASMQYYFKARDSKYDGVWTGMYYDDDIDENVFSYSRAIYEGDQFIGVAGADIVATETDKLIHSLKLYDEGTAALFDSEYGYIIEPDMDAKANDILSAAFRKNADSESGLFSYNSEGRKYSCAYDTMDNGWKIATIQPSDKAYAPVKRVRTLIFGTAALIGIFILAFMYIYFRRFISREEALERENQEKDILLAYESKRAKIGEMVGNVAHQWKQPLHAINLTMANLLDSYHYDEFNEDTLTKSVSKVEEITGRMSETISDFSAFMKPDSDNAKDFDLVECVKGALSLMEENLARNRVFVDMKGEKEAKVYGYPNEMRHVLFNVLDNARDAVVDYRQEDRKINIEITKEEGNIVLSISDNGAGLSQEAAERIFDPYYTTKKKDGTGLGLYIARNVVEKRMKGNISLIDTGEGARCIIVLPEQAGESRQAKA